MAWRERSYLHWRDGDGAWQSRTFGQTVQEVWRVSRWLLDAGFGGGRIALYGRNCYAWMVLDLSAMGYVGTCFPLDREYGREELRRILSVSDLALLLYSGDKEETVAPLMQEFPGTCFLSMEACLLQASGIPAVDDFFPRDPEAEAQVLFTSGTSAAPKAVALSQRNLFHNWGGLFARTPMTQEDRLYLILPLSHVYAGVAAFLYTIVSGMQIYLGASKPEQYPQDFQEVKPTVLISVPLQLERLYAAAQARRVPLSEFLGGAMRLLYCGGVRVDPGLKRDCIAQGAPVLEAYGLSETASVVAVDAPGDTRPGSVGRPLEGLEVRIAAPDSRGQGEIVVRGGSVMRGYFQNPELNRRVFDGDGFFHTGDIGRLDEEGYLYVLGRSKRMIVTANGKNVYPDELEAGFCRHPSVRRATLTERDGGLHLWVWYCGDKEQTEQWLLEQNRQLPKYQRFAGYTLTEDEPGKRLK